jgi:predicted aspartyl protease
MKKASHAGLAIKIALFYFTTAAFCHTIQAQSQIPFRLVQGTLIVLSVTANDSGPFDFVLDTGADTTILDPSVASQLSLVSLDRVQQTTLASVQSLSRGSLRTLSLGPTQSANFPVLVQDLSSLRQIDPRIAGILGQDFLSHMNYLIDYRKRVVRIETDTELGDSIEGQRLPLQTTENRMLVPVEAQARNHATLRLLLDSGANSLVLLHSASQALDLSAKTAALETTSSGQVGLQVSRVRELRVGAEKFHDLAAALPASEPAERIGDGLLPMLLFQSVYINNREKFAMLNPRPR